MTKTKFNIGDKVVLRGSSGYSKGGYNQLVGIGEIIEIMENTHSEEDFHPYLVEWEDKGVSRMNDYRDCDLEVPVMEVTEDTKVVEEETSEKPKENVWTDSHYDHNYILTKEEIEQGFVKLDVYKVAKAWKIGSKDDSGALWHTFKVFPRFGEKNTREREIIAMHKQIKCLAEIENVELPD